MQLFYRKQLSQQQLADLCTRPSLQLDAILPVVQSVLDAVKQSGDQALYEYTAKFDRVQLDALTISTNNFNAVDISAELKTAISTATQNIRTFHAAVMVKPTTLATMPGLVCTSQPRGLTAVGLYVPGGTAPLVSSVLMLGIPAQLAGCRTIVLCTPPPVAPALVYAAKVCGIATIYMIGGAQAIAAMAYGTATVPKVDKIFGPGNQYVTAAKQLVSIDPNGAAIDLPAGPSEVMVLADDTAKPEFVAADLLAQAEHGVDSQAVLVTTSAMLAQAVQAELLKQLKALPRQAIAEQALEQSFILVTETSSEVIAFANQYAPEHLLVQLDQPEQYIDQIVNAGSVFLGAYACESAGDYASGPNHTLPTAGYARAYGGVAVASFQKQITFQTVTPQAAQALAPAVITLAQTEGLQAHARAMAWRTQLL